MKFSIGEPATCVSVISYFYFHIYRLKIKQKSIRLSLFSSKPEGKTDGHTKKFPKLSQVRFFLSFHVQDL